MNTNFLDVVAPPDVVEEAIAGIAIPDGVTITDLSESPHVTQLSIRHPDSQLQMDVTVTVFQHLQETTRWPLHAIDGTTERTIAKRL